MKIRYTVTLAILAGVAIGATAIKGLNAQAKPPTYVVIDISETTDPEGFKAVHQRCGWSSAAYGPWRTLHHPDRNDNRIGWRKRFVVLAFDSREKAQGWADATDIKEINAIRAKTTKSRAFIVDGFAN
jgi:uncharacterized protein (DUF1330 family)